MQSWSGPDFNVNGFFAWLLQNVLIKQVLGSLKISSLSREWKL